MINMRSTLGDVVTAKANADKPAGETDPSLWRAERRAAGIPSRAPRPDRGFIEQPEERVTPPPRRVIIPMSRIEEERALDAATGPAMHQPVPDEAGPNTLGQAMLALAQGPGEPPASQNLVKVDRTTVYAQPPAVAAANDDEEIEDEDDDDDDDGDIERSPSGRKKKVVASLADKVDTVQRILRGDETPAQAALRLNVTRTAVHNWVSELRGMPGIEPDGGERTLLSTRAGSLPMPTASGPAKLEVSVSGLEGVVAKLVDERVAAVIEVRIAEAVKAELRRRLAGD